MSHLSSPRFMLPLLAGLAATVWGCNPKIGDDCTTSTDCSTNGDRLCDTTQPGGYCTIFNCEPDTCPDEAQCVAFDTELDPACNDQRWARFERTFCMRRCHRDGDCRSGYVCFNMNTEPNPWGARIADLDPEGSKVCIVPYSGSPVVDTLSEVCSPYDGGFPDATSPPDAEAEDVEPEASDNDTDAAEEDALSDADAAEEDALSDTDAAEEDALSDTDAAEEDALSDTDADNEDAAG